ncbi:MAG: hypothetical protein Q4F00_01470 [bacterium]|nr:hypothetical protein [bacterium]
MSYAICHLCRAKIPCPSAGNLPERCPKCQSKVPRDAEIYGSDPSQPNNWLCPSCLGKISPQMLAQSEDCPICGEAINRYLAAALGEKEEEIVHKPLLRMLAGESSSSIAASLQQQGINEEQVWRCLDRLIAELPFERQRQESAGHPAQLSAACDSCGIIGELALYDAEWYLNPDELKRYRSGYAGFDGQFADSKTYARQAVYCLCKKCYKRSGKDDFADGYPRKFGYKLKRIKKRK